MLGGEFQHHGPQVSVECLNQDPQHPADVQLGKTWTIRRKNSPEISKAYQAHILGGIKWALGLAGGAAKGNR